MLAALLVLVLALTIYSLLDCARTPEESMPARMPKLLWVALIAVITPIGPIAWIIGAVEPTVWSSKEGTTFHRAERPRPVAPDDDPEFLRGLEQDIRRKRHHHDESSGESPEDSGPDDNG